MAFSCESRCSCSVFSFLFIRHFAAATRFFSSDCFLFCSSGECTLSAAPDPFLVDFRFRPGVVVAGVGAVSSSLDCVLDDRFRRASGAMDLGESFSSNMAESVLAAELDRGGVIWPYRETAVLEVGSVELINLLIS